MAELVFVTVFNTHTCRKKVNKKLAKRQKFKKLKRFQTSERNAVLR